MLIENFYPILGQANCLNSDQARKTYSINTLAIEREVLGALIPLSVEQLPQILVLAQQLQVSLYPFSTGKNWGYGSSLPVTRPSLLIDLSKLNRIIEFNAQLGYVIVEPGVTQQDLYDFIQKNDLNFMVPTTGAGPLCSLLGNALEKGYGLTPIEDHSMAMLGVKAFLPDGSLYESQLHEFGGFRSDRVFKWKIGPQLDGLFPQSNLGIVFQATIALAPKPKNVIQVIAFVSEDKFEDAVHAIRSVKMQLGSIAGGINMMNRRRVLAMIAGSEVWSLQLAAGENLIRKMAKKQNLPEWIILGGLYGPEEVVQAAQSVVRAEFDKITNKTVFLNRKTVDLVKKIIQFLPLSNLKKLVQAQESALRILEGQPSQVALPLAYLKNRLKPNSDVKFLSPDRDNCGLIWFSPLLPIESHLVRDFVSEVHRVCLYYEIEPLVTLTAISERCFDSTIPILFDKTQPLEILKAQHCHRDLIKMAQDFGVFPYRLDIESMHRLYNENQGVAARLWKQIKSKIDPAGIISPGRYE
jgi:4-cresol dehydrogenase (hydroxylating) flavoprotein subunit